MDERRDIIPSMDMWYDGSLLFYVGFRNQEIDLTKDEFLHGARSSGAVTYAVLNERGIAVEYSTTDGSRTYARVKHGLQVNLEEEPVKEPVKEHNEICKEDIIAVDLNTTPSVISSDSDEHCKVFPLSGESTEPKPGAHPDDFSKAYAEDKIPAGGLTVCRPPAMSLHDWLTLIGNLCVDPRRLTETTFGTHLAMREGETHRRVLRNGRHEDIRANDRLFIRSYPPIDMDVHGVGGKPVMIESFRPDRVILYSVKEYNMRFAT